MLQQMKKKKKYIIIVCSTLCLSLAIFYSMRFYNWDSDKFIAHQNDNNIESPLENDTIENYDSINSDMDSYKSIINQELEKLANDPDTAIAFNPQTLINKLTLQSDIKEKKDFVVKEFNTWWYYGIIMDITTNDPNLATWKVFLTFTTDNKLSSMWMMQYSKNRSAGSIWWELWEYSFNDILWLKKYLTQKSMGNIYNKSTNNFDGGELYILDANYATWKISIPFIDLTIWYTLVINWVNVQKEINVIQLWYLDENGIKEQYKRVDIY